MNVRLSIAALMASVVSVTAFAHDPKEHQKEAAQAADCSKMKNMDMSKMDMNDPVMKAMHKKCSAQMSKPGPEHEAMEHGAHMGHEDAAHPSASKDATAAAPADKSAKSSATQKTTEQTSGAEKAKKTPEKPKASSAGTP